jgi:hypothetical protein
MSEAKLEKSPEEIRDFIVKAVIDKWNEWEQSIQEPNYPIWRDAEQLLESLMAIHDEDLIDYSRIPRILAKLTGIDPDTFYYDMWGKLPFEQRAEVLLSIENYIALRGIEAFIKTIAPDVIARLNDRKLWEDLGWFDNDANKEVFGEPKNWFLSEATDFFRRVRFRDFLHTISEVLWPEGEWWRLGSEEFSKLNYDKVSKDDLWTVGLLAGFVTDKNGLKRIVREYLVNPLKKHK